LENRALWARFFIVVGVLGLFHAQKQSNQGFDMHAVDNSAKKTENYYTIELLLEKTTKIFS
jgi:hypothetical protein